MSRRYLIIGDGAAGTQAAGRLRRADPGGRITVVSDDPNPAYFRAALTNYLLGELREDQIWATTPSFYSDHQIERVHSRALVLDPTARQLYLTDAAAALPYDTLLVASGARARPAPFEGGDLRGVMTLRSLHDVRAVLELASEQVLRSVVVVGGGPLGLEWALGLRMRGIAVTVVLRTDGFMPGTLDRVASDLLAARLRHAGVGILPNDEVATVRTADARVRGVVTRGGVELECDMVAVAIGVQPNVEYLASSGIALGPGGGVIVDAQMRTSLPDVYAAGDVTEPKEPTPKLWHPAQEQARVAATNMVGGRATYEPGAHYIATRLYDLDFASVGDLDARPDDQVLSHLPTGTGTLAYRKLVVRHGRLVGALMLGAREARVRTTGRQLKAVIDRGADVRSVARQLLDSEFDVGGWLGRRALLEPAPVAPGALGQDAAPATLRRTQALRFHDFGHTPTGTDDDASPPASRFLGTQLLANYNRLPEAVRASTLPAETEDPHPMLSVGDRSFELTRDVTSIGRDPRGDVVLNDTSVSHVHANVVRFKRRYYLRDLGSPGGTRVDGRPITVPHRLADGDRIRIGLTDLLFRSRSERSPTLEPDAPMSRVAEAAHPRVEVVAGRSVGLTFMLRAQTVLLGAAPECAVTLDEPTVSPRHAVLMYDEGRWKLRDLGSRHGTRTGGTALASGQDAFVSDGVLIELGGVVLAFHAPIAPGGSP